MLANLLCGNQVPAFPHRCCQGHGAADRGRLYLSAATISGIGRGRVPLTPDRVAGFAGHARHPR